ncbi:MAG: hypothetical protein C4521_04735 [Actinobacteria bacterium]|nr:MAG: hypothetical protein C4521_04735 [Actinomycetota bacterium]
MKRNRKIVLTVIAAVLVVIWIPTFAIVMAYPDELDAGGKYEWTLLPYLGSTFLLIIVGVWAAVRLVPSAAFFQRRVYAKRPGRQRQVNLWRFIWLDYLIVLGLVVLVSALDYLVSGPSRNSFSDAYAIAFAIAGIYYVSLRFAVIYTLPDLYGRWVCDSCRRRVPPKAAACPYCEAGSERVTEPAAAVTASES